ncbi:YSIRK-type signal peptide-containing protein, partial [Staphylococcus auricularis]
MKKKLDFLPNRENKYSIRKFTVGTASILISSLLFLSANGVADAAEDNQANSEHKQTSTTKDSEQSEHDPDEKDIQRQKEIDELEHEESEVTVDDAEDTDEAAHTDNDDENIEDESAEETETEPSAEENNENDADDSDDEAQRQKEIDELEHEESEVTEEEGDESEEPSQEATDDTEEATTDEDEATKEEENEASDETSNEEESTNENENTDENVDETSDSEDEGEEAPADEGSNEATTDENNQSETQDDDEADHQPVHKSQKAAESDDTTQKDDNETSTETPNEENHESEATDEENTPDESTPATKPAEDHESDQDDASEEHENTEAEDDKDTTSEDKDTPRTDEGIDTEGKLFPDKEKEEPASDAETRDDKATTNSEQASTETPQITQKDAKKYELTDAKQFKAGIKDEGNKQQFVEDYLKDNDVSQKESQDIAKRVIPNNKDVTSDEVYDALRLKLLKRAAETQDQMQPKATPAESRVRTNNRFVTASIPASRAQDRAVQDQARTDYSKLLNIQKTSEGTAKGNDWTSMNAVKFRLLDNGKVELDVTLNQNEGLSFGFNAIDRYTVKFNDYLKDHVESVTTEGDQLTNKGNGEYEIEYKRALSLVSNGKPLSFKAVINTDDFDPKSALSIRYHRQVNTGILKGADVYNLTFQDFATFLNQYKDVYEEISNFDAVDDTKKEILLSRFENINSLPNLQETAASVRNEGKTMVKDQINNMSNLSDDEKAKYTKQVDDSKNLTDNNNVVKEAQKQDAGNLVNKQKDQGKNGINDLSDLTDDQKSDFNDQIDKAPNKNAIDQIVKKAQQQNTTNVLNNQKTQGNQQLDDLSNLSDDEKSQFKDQIDKANDKAGIDQVLKDAQQQDDKNLLNVQKTNGNKQLDGLSNLTDNEKSQFKKQITDATTKEAIDQAVNDAKARDVQAEAENNLNKAKQTAQTTVDGLTHLTDSNRSDIKKQLQNAKTPEAVTDILKNAQQQDADNQLDEQKQQGTAELNKINNLTEEEKARFRDLISKATTKDAIDQAITDAQTQSSNNVLNNQKSEAQTTLTGLENLTDKEREDFKQQLNEAQTKASIDEIINNAKQQDGSNLLKQQQTEGKTNLAQLHNLTDEEMADFTQQLDEATSKSVIDDVINRAQGQDASNLLSKQRNQGNQQIDAFTHLSDDEKSNYTQQINDAKNQKAIQDVVNKAQQQDASNLLNNQKTDGSKEINGLADLTDDEKAQYNQQVTDAETQEDIEAAINQAKAQNVKNKADKDLSQAKTAAQSEIERLTHLTDDNQTSIQQQLNDAKTPDAVAKVVEQAQQQDADNLLHSQKDEGSDAISALEHLTDDEKAQYKQQVTDADAEAAINQIVADAKAKDADNLLNTQKSTGNGNVNALEHLSDDEKAQFNDQIKKATTAEAINHVVNDAKAQDLKNKAAKDLSDAKSDAQTTIEQLSHLTEDNQDAIAQQLADAKTPEDVANIVSQAQQQDASNLLDSQRQQGTTTVSGLSHLSEEEQGNYTNQLNDAATKADIDRIVEDAKAQDATNLLNNQRQQGAHQISGLANLSSDEKDSYQQQINKAKSKADIDQIYEAAEQQDAANLLNTQKQQGHTNINQLADLSDDEKDQFNQQVNDATTKEAIDQAINKAKAQNIANKDLSQAKDNAKTALGQLTHLTEDNTTSFNKQLAEAKTPDAVSDIIRKAQQQDASNLLNTQKQQGVSEIDRLADLTDDEKDQFKQQVNDATSQAAIEKIVSDATDQGASNLLNKQKQQGTTSVNGLTNLSDDEKSDFAKRVNDATSKEAIDEAVNEATAKDLQNKAAKDLSDAKRDAQVEIERLTHLTEDNRTNINQQLDSAGTPSDVANIIRDAQQQDADNLLSAQRGEGQGSIDQLNHLSNEAKSAFKEQIGKAATKANIDEILANAQQQDATNLLNRQKQQGTSDIDALSELTDEEKAEFQRLVQGASNKETIDETVNNAKAQDVKNKAAKDLEKAKSDAATTIADLSHLTVANRAEIEQQLDEAKDPDAVLEVVKSAQDQDASNLLNEQKDQGHTDVNALNHLSDDEKATFNEQVKKATSKKAIDDVIEHAKQQDADNLLQNQKDEGNSAIGKLTHLSEDEKKAFNEQINLATDKAEIDQIKQAANTKDASNLLGNQKSDARNEVSGLEDLSDNEQSDFNEQINAATTKQEIDQIVADAKAKDVANKDLSSAKQQGQSTVSGLSHLSEDEKSDLSSQINQAKNPEAVADIIQQAQEQDAANLLDSQKSDAHQTVGQLSNLTEEEQTMMNQQIDQAKTKANIDDIISQAKQRDADNLLSSQKQQGIGEIDGLSHLTQEEQATFNEQINYAKDKKAVDDAVASAKAKDAANLLDEQKESGAHEVSGLKDLTNEQRQAFNQRIKDASTKEDIDQVIDDAKAKDASNLLDKQKSAGTNEVNGLKDLSESEQQGFNQRIQDASSKEDIDQIVTEAKAKDVENKDLSDAKQQGHATVDDLSNLTEEQLNAYTEQVDQAGNPEAVADVVKKAQAQDAANLLQHQKDDGTSTVKGLGNLTQEELEDYQDQIHNADNKATIDNIIDKATQQDASNLLNKQKGEGTTSIKGLTHLSEDEVADFEQQIKNANDKATIDHIVDQATQQDATNLLNNQKDAGTNEVNGLKDLSDAEQAEFNQRIKDAVTKEDIDRAVADAKAKDVENKDLSDAKQQGQAAIDQLSNLTDSEQQTLKQQLNDAKSPAAVAEIVQQAQGQDATNLLNSQKANGTTDVGQLSHLTDKQLADYQDQINKANDKATIDDIVEQAKTQDATNLLNNQKADGTNEINRLEDLTEEEQDAFNQRIKDAATKEDIDGAVADAKAKAIANKDLAQAKQDGQATVNPLQHLTDEERTDILEQINNAQTPEAVADIVNKAQETDATNLLNRQKGEGTDTVQALTHLKEEEAAKFEQQITNATDQATIDDIVEKAQQQDAANLLDQQKANGTNEVNGLEDLSKEEQEEFNQRIKGATTKEDIDQAVADAKAKNVENKDLAQAKQEGQDTVNALDHLTDEEISDIKEQLNTAKTPEAVAQIVKSAQDTDATNLLNRQRGESTDTIQALDHLTEEEFNHFAGQINNAKDKETIDSIVEQAKQQDATNLLNRQRGESTDAIQELDHLTEEEFNNFADQINNATDKAEIDEIVERAKQQDATNLLNRQRGESTDAIQELDHLTEEEFDKYANQINNAKDKETIDGIVEEAKAQDADNLLNRQRGEGTDTIQELDHLTEEEFNNFADQINNAKDKETIDSIVEEAKQQDATNLLNRQRGEGTDTIEALDHLTEEEFNKYANQIKNAKDKATIDGIVEEAKQQDADNLLNRQRGESTDAIQELDHLTEEEFNSFADQINNAKDKATIDGIVEEAKQQDADNLLNRQRGEGTDTIQELNHLTEEEFNNFAEQINNAKDKATIDSIVEEAKAQDADNLLNRQRGEGKDTIQALDYLTEEEFNKYVIQINYAKDKATIDSIVEEAKQQDADNLLNSQKEDGTNEVSNLTDLTESEKETFNKRIKDATTKEEIDKAVADAKAKDIENKDLTEAKSNGKTEVEGLNNLSDEESGQVQVNEDIDNAKTPEEVADIVKAAQDQDASNLLDKQKAEGTTIIKGLDNLRDEEVGTFTDQIKNATDQATIDDIVEEAKDQDADNLLNSQKDDGTNEVNGLKDLTDSEKETFNKRIKDATTKEEIDKAVADAKAKDIENKDLTEAKSNGKTEVEELNNLSDEESDQVSEDIDNAKTPEEVADIVKAAQDQDASNLLDKQKAEGTTIVEDLSNLSDEEINHFTEQINNAKDQSTIEEIVETAQGQDADNLLISQKEDGTNEVNGLKDLTDSEKETFNKRIENATTKEELDKVVADAKAKDIENKDLTEAKSNGKTEVEELNNLTDEESDQVSEDIDNAKTPEEVADIVKAAQDQDASNLLDKQKAEGTTTIKGLDNLSDEEVDNFTDQIKNATDQATIDDIVEEAKDQDADNLLNSQKEEGINEVNGLKDLTDTEKETFNKRVQDATTKEEIDKAVADAKAKDIENKDLTEAKSHGNSELDQLNHLTNEEKAKFKEQINQAKTSEEIADIVKAAQRQDASNLLDNQKADGKDNVDSLKHLSQEEKDKYKHDIDDAKTKEEIDSIINKAKDEDNKHQTEESLTKAKEHGKDNVDKLKHLSQDQKDKYKHDIDDAKTKEEIDNIINKAKDEDNKHQTEESLTKAKEHGKDNVDKLKHLSQDQKDKYKHDIDDAKTKEEIDNIINKAKDE